MSIISVEESLRAAIAQHGYIGIDDMMRITMSASSSSYYRSKQPLGQDADFITSPEISQMFGEMIGVWCVDIWQRLGRPSDVTLVELGPGRGLLMRDLLRATQHVKGFHDAIHIELLEINPLLIDAQKEVLSFFSHKIRWITSINEITKSQSIIVANEFFDALPSKQYIKVKKEWNEIVLMIDPKNHLKFEHCAVLSKILAEQLLHEHPRAGDGAVIEESIESLSVIKYLTDHIKLYDGAMLVIDYGYDLPPILRQDYQYTSTLQAIHNHQFHHILATLGEADLSTHVDFYAMKAVAEARHGLVFGSVEQGEFLRRLGIEVRLKALITQNPGTEVLLKKQYHRLTSKEQMGSLFRAIAITGRESMLPLGFSAVSFQEK